MGGDCADKIEKETKNKYDGGIYKEDTICAKPTEDPKSYADGLLYEKFELVKRNLGGTFVLDLCCGSGLHLLVLGNLMKFGVGLDFSRKFIEEAREKKDQQHARNIAFIEGNARRLPFKEGVFGCIYSFSSLYHIPNVHETIYEISRVLDKGGRCVIELGNLWSLNTIVCRAYPELASPCHISVGKMKRAISGAGLRIVEHRAFQLLPLWGDRPRWLYPILAPFWNRIMKKRIKGKMIDEYVSSIRFVRPLAFRHIFVCQKGNSAVP